MDPFTKERGVVIAPLRPVDVEELPVEAAAGRFLAEAVRAALPVPRDRCSAMDGYAVRASEVVGPGALEVRRVI